MARQLQAYRNFALLVLLWVQVQSSLAFDVTSYLSKYKLEPADEHEDGGESDAIACPISCHNGGTCAWGPADYSMFPAADTSGGVDVPFKFLTQTSRLGRHCACPWGSTGLRCSVPYKMERSNATKAVHVCFHGGTIIEGLSDAIDADQQFCDCSTATFRGRKFVGKYCELTEREAEKEDASNPSPPCNLDCGPGECKVAFANAQSSASASVSSIPANEKLRVPAQTQETSTTLSHTYCQCPEQFSGEICEIDLTSATVVVDDIEEHLPRDDPGCNLDCGLGYCQRGGMMQQQSDTNYTQAYEKSNGEDFMVCICPQNSHGQNCEAEDPSNDGSSSDADWYCLNGGVVKTDAENSDKPYCYCKQGFEGDHCEYKHGQVPTCDIACGDHGTCTLGVNKYVSNITQNDPELESALQYFKNDEFQHCKCDEGWVGGTCDLKVDLCGEDRHICLHGSTCLQQSDNSYRCDCRDAYTAESRYAGQYCQHHHTEVCHPSGQLPFSGAGSNLFCVNDGACKQSTNSFSLGNPECDCGPLYYGRHCEFSKSFTGELSPGQEEQLISQAGLTAYLFFISVVLVVFAVLGYYIYRKSGYLAESRLRRVEEESSGCQLQVRRPSLTDTPPMDDVQIL